MQVPEFFFRILVFASKHGPNGKIAPFYPALILPLLHIQMPMSYLKRGDEIQCAFYALDD